MLEAKTIKAYFFQKADVIFLIVLVCVFFLFGLLFSLNTSTFNAPDERMHYYYIQTIGETGRLPHLTAEKVTNESHQPPLYYIVTQPVYWLVRHASERTAVLAVRFFTLLISSGTIIAAWILARKLFPDNRFIRLAAPAFVAMNPQFIFMSGVITNDSVANLFGVIGLACVVWTLYADGLTKKQLTLNMVIAILAFLSKSVLWPIAAILFLVTLWRGGRKMMKEVFAWFTPLYVMVIWWLARNVELYHSLTGYGYMRELWYAQQHKDFLTFDGMRQWLNVIFQSYWARFAYFNIVLPVGAYSFLKITSILSGFGLVLFIRKQWSRLTRQNRLALIALAAAVVIVFTGIFSFSLSFYMPQGRYLFPVMVPLCIFLAIGLSQLWPRRIDRWALGLVFFTLLLLDWKSLILIKLYG